jgi:hypothetical protein
MAFEPHPELPVPADSASIWHYQTFTKFVSLLSRRGLYFVAADRLEAFDPLEGSYTRANLQIDQTSFEQLSEDMRAKLGISDPVKFKSRDQLRAQVKNALRQTFSSWHVGEHESAAMWKIYATEDAGIAIRSTVGRLKRSLDTYIDYPVTISSVGYINYETDIIPENYLLHPMFFKRKSYEYENELRALVNTGSSGESAKRQTTLDDRKQVDTIDVRGLYATIDIDALIEAVYVSPKAPLWLVELVRSVSESFASTLQPSNQIFPLRRFISRTCVRGRASRVSCSGIQR